MEHCSQNSHQTHPWKRHTLLRTNTGMWVQTCLLPTARTGEWEMGVTCKYGAGLVHNCPVLSNQGPHDCHTRVHLQCLLLCISPFRSPPAPLPHPSFSDTVARPACLCTRYAHIRGAPTLPPTKLSPCRLSSFHKGSLSVTLR